MRTVVLIVGLAASLASVQARAQAVPDFDGDGYADLAVGVIGDNVSGVNSAGSVNVIYGAPPTLPTAHAINPSPDALTAIGDQLWHQNSPGILGDVEENDFFGAALAWGDFNGDGFSDLAVSVPQENLLFELDTGIVHVIYGSGAGLSAAGSQAWHQDSPGILDEAESGDWFGSSLAAADFDGDGFSDLAVGVYQEVLNGNLSAGAVNVIYGSPAGLAAAGNQFWHQDSASILEVSEEGDGFSRSMTAGDFNGDGFGDLAVGVPGEGGPSGSGAVSVIYGSGAGLTAVGDQLWQQNSPGIREVGEVGDALGLALAAGDFDGDGYTDLAAAARLENIGNLDDAGAVNVIYGSPAGLAAAGNQVWHQNSPGIRDLSEAFDHFGRSLAAGDFNGDGRADLAVGVSSEDVGGNIDQGVVQLIYGTPAGLAAAGTQRWHQDSPGILGESGIMNSDRWGWSLVGADYDGDGFTDLAVGAPHDSEVIGLDAMGVVNVIYGSAVGLTAGGNQLLHQNSPGILGVADDDDRFGSSLSGVDSR